MKIKQIEIGKDRIVYCKASLFDWFILKHFKIAIAIECFMFLVVVAMGVKIIHG